ncbi:hypothetical protein [Rhodococcus rhodochrous]|uniref:hypothetical protein n=1 Tax=Rhodococcus rhodochrous TaxID=1829 RepID=UPI001D02B626|nr:hypothetical protein [Rhodococcus rhodochrous]
MNNPPHSPDDGPIYDPSAEYRNTKPVHRQHRMAPRHRAQPELEPVIDVSTPQPQPARFYDAPPGTPVRPMTPTPEQLAAQRAEEERQRQWAQWQDDVRRQAWEEAQRQAAAQYTNRQYNGPVQQVTVNNNVRAGGRCPHGLHFVLTLLTCGLWLPIWIIHAIVDAFR